MEIREFKFLMLDNIRKISERLNLILNELGSKYGLSALQLRILMEVYQNEKNTIGSLASSIMIAGANLSTMCKKLESADYLTRRRNRSDEREVLITLTENGKTVMVELDRLLEEKMRRAVESDTKTTLDLQLIISAMKAMNELLYRFDEEG